MIKTLILGVLVMTAIGCTNQTTLYDWGKYEDNLFNYYHNPAVKEAVVANHIEFLARLESQGRTPAPGLLAEAGTLLLLQGDRQEAVRFYQMEHDAWPESQLLMNTLIQNLQDD